MRTTAAVALALLSVLACAAATDVKVTPVQKVIQLLQGMLEKGKKEKHEEQVQFAAYKQFCDDTTVEKTRAIAEANEMIEKLNADIVKYETDAATLEKEIAKHDDDIATWSGDEKASSKVRQLENSDYLATHKDYTESITALKNGIKTLMGENKVTAQASLMQISTFAIPEESKRVIDNFLEQGEEDLAALQESAGVQQPAAAAYEFQSQGLVDMLNKLATKFEDEQTELEKQETAAKQAFELLSQDLKMYIETATKGRMEKSEAKGKALEASGDAKSDLSDTTATRDADSKYLADLTATCEQKSAAFEDRQKLRGEEIEAVEKAIEILSSTEVSGAADKNLPAMIQTSTALAQLRNTATSPTQLSVAAYLNDQGMKINSRILRVLAMRVSEDPFKKVTKMIKDLITKLMEEANGEAEQKGWCDDELSTSEQTRVTKTEETEALHAEIDELEASVQKLTEEITDLSTAISESDAAVAKATSIRDAEKAKNTVTIKEAKDAQVAVASALKVLQDFYAKAGEATSLMQQPEVFDEPYKGMGGENGGVVGMIEVIQSDFARLESETTAGEADAQKEYDDFMADSKADKEQKNADIDSKTTKKASDTQTLEGKKSDLAGTQKELAAALEYYEKLKPQCIDQGVSYEDRVARRKEEIESLKEALSILEGDAVF